MAKMQIGPSTIKCPDPSFYDSEISGRLEKISHVVYRAIGDDTLWVCPEAEFLDGRFEQYQQQTTEEGGR